MLLIFDEDLIKDVKVLSTFPFEIVREFCRVSSESIFKGINPKLYSSAASKLDVSSDVVKQAVESLMRLFLESAKMQLSKSDFLLSLKVLGFTEELEAELANRYSEKSPELREVLKATVPPHRHYEDLEWRVDVKLASRSLRQQVEPSILLRLHTTSGVDRCDSTELTTLQVDPTNLVHLARCLEEALSEVDQKAHCRRIVRNL